MTIPVAASSAAGLAAGERVVARADGPGRVLLEREHDVVADFAGALTGVFSPDELASETGAEILLTTDRRWPTSAQLGVRASILVI